MFYDLFCELCNKKGISVTKATVEIGLSRTIGTKWKNTGATPNGDTLNKIAEYFGVTTDYLLGAETKKASTPKDERSSDPDIRRIERARNNMSEKDKKKMMELLELSFEDYFSDDFQDDDLDE